MNESNPETIAAPPLPLPPFKDRSIGLTIFGILTILLGCLAGLCVLLMLAGMAVPAKNAHVPPTPISSLLPAMAIYLGVAAALILLGIGSIMARRWARALLLIFSWGWLVMGIITVTMMGFFMPKVFANLPANPPNGQPAMPAGFLTGVMVFMFVFFGIFFILMPAIWTFFYKSHHVKATCEARDPVIRWTDACPLPVLGLSLWLFLSVPMLLAMPLMYRGVFPFFGMFLSGLPGSLLYVVVAGLWAYSAYLLYRLEVRGWWLILVAMGFYLVSFGVTLTRHDMTEWYQRMGYPQAQIDQIQKMGLMTGNHMEWMMLIFAIPFVGYLLFVKQYLRKA